MSSGTAAMNRATRNGCWRAWPSNARRWADMLKLAETDVCATESARKHSTPQRFQADRAVNLDQWCHEPVFVFTCDLDWAPEWAIAELFNRFDEADIPFMPFITHASPLVAERFADRRAEVGLHPNFLDGSSHGGTVDEVVAHVIRLWPEARCFRSHCFVDATPITDRFAAHGFTCDSNLCLFLQPKSVPLIHNSGLLRIPVFWEDDIHYKRGLSAEFSSFASRFMTPGLKVINVHPFLYALNVPDETFYEQHRHLIQSDDDTTIKRYAHPGKGVRTFVDELINHVVRQSRRVTNVGTVYSATVGSAETGHATNDTSLPADKNPPPVIEGSQATYEAYQRADKAERARIIREIYNQRNVTDVYATSRDHNLRELEIDFIRRHLAPGAVLDVGCGNGYTVLSLATTLEADFLGLDFSEQMIRGAQTLTEQRRDQLRAIPRFGVADIRSLPCQDNSFDFVISERCLQNLPDREDQYRTLDEIRRVLRPGGRYVMVEGTEDGLQRLNRLRRQLGLDEIPSSAPDNISALKFFEKELEVELDKRFVIVQRQYFGTYYLISRIVHPLLVHPAKPRFDAPINAVARRVAEVLPDCERLGHVMGYVLEVRK
ncbi:MAG: methyltransferase domain-containing protein [Candidatus Zixiibacteriota bacterium]|nr:MAG: methyltransferase domain-containing protein [candidate division Zixibacteria bacterium]